MRRLYFFEAFTLLNLGVIAVLSAQDLASAVAPLVHIVAFSAGLGIQVVAGVAIRIGVALARGDRGYIRRLWNRRWIFDTIRLIVGGATMITTYLWIKLVVPIHHARLFDQELWELDQLLALGLAPTILLLDLFTGPALWVFDLTYAKIFYASGIIATAFFLSDPGRRLRVAYANGNSLLWLSGAWLYMLVPSLGPAYRFPEIWMAHADSFPVTQSLQAQLMRNYQNVLRAASGEAVTAPIHIAFGIGAFPSLHVAFQMYVFLWMRRLWTSGEVLFGIFVVTIFLGSMITGWHYLVDAIAGIVIALVSYRLFWKVGRLERWLRLFVARKVVK